MSKKFKKILSSALASAMVLSTLVVPVMAENTSYTPMVEGDTVLNEWKFDLGSESDVEAGYLAVTPDMNVITSGTYGFLGNTDQDYRLTDRYDSFSLTEGTQVDLQSGGGTGLKDAIGSTDKYYPTRFALKVDNGTYYRVRATVTGLDQTKDATATLFSEKRHPIYTEKTISASESYTVDFSADVQTVYYEKSSPVGNYVDDLLNIVVVGENSAISSIEVQQVTPGTTLWVLGDSTVCDQGAAIPYFPLQNYAGVGQALSKYVPTTIAVSNHGEGGLNAKDSSHFANVKNNIKAGDYMFVEYGHNHKDDGPSGYLSALPKYYEAAHAVGAYLIIVGPIDRHNSDQYNAETNVWKSTLSGFSDIGKQYVEDKIADGATDIAFIDLNMPSLEWFTELTSTVNDAKMTNYYFQTTGGGGTDGTHPNDAGIDKFAHLFFESSKKVIDANTPVQSDVLKGLVENMSSEQPVPVLQEIIDLGWAPNSAWPVMPLPPVTFPYPMVIKDITTDEEGVFTNMTVDILASFGTYGRGIVAVYNADGTLSGTAFAIDQIDNSTGTGTQTVSFNTDLKLNEGQTYAAYVWGFEDTEGYPLTMVPFAKPYEPTGIDSYLVEGEDTEIEQFKYYGLDAGNTIVGYGGWGSGGSGVTKIANYEKDETTSYLHLEGDGVKGTSAGQGSFTLYKPLLETIYSSGKYMISFDAKYTSGGGISLSFSKDASDKEIWGKGSVGFRIEDGGAVTFGENTATAGSLAQGQWINVKYILDMDNAIATLSVAGGDDVTYPVANYATIDTEISPEYLNSFLIDSSKVIVNMDITNLEIAKLKTEPLPEKELTITYDSVMGSVEAPTTAIKNETVTIKAIANSGYAFTGWEYAAGGVFAAESEKTFRLVDDMNLVATFAEQSGLSGLVKYDITADQAFVKVPTDDTPAVVTMSIANAVDKNNLPIEDISDSDITWEVETPIAGVSIVGNVLTITSDYILDDNTSTTIAIKAICNNVEKKYALPVHTYAGYYYEGIENGTVNGTFDGLIMKIAGSDTMVFPGASTTSTYTLAEPVQLANNAQITYKNSWTGINTCGQFRTLKFLDSDGKSILASDIYYSWGSLFVDGVEIAGVITKDTWTDITIDIDKTAGTATVTFGSTSQTVALAADGAADIASIQFVSASSAPGPEARALGIDELIIKSFS